MPLIIICGTPLSGKSYRAKQLYDYFVKSSETSTTESGDSNSKDTSGQQKCVIVSDEEKLADIGPNEIYKNASQEKELRGWLKSEAQRNLSLPGTIVILDASNYIKGFRYELHCISKLVRTTHVVIECAEPPSIDPNLLMSDGNDDKRLYSQEIFTELCQRYEQANPSNRWDSPLFRIEYNEKELPYSEINEAVFNRAALKPNLSTLSMPQTTDNFLYELDNQTQTVIKQIQNALQRSQLRDIRIKDSQIVVNLNKKIPIAELNKLRRQFINYTKMHPFNENERIATAFVQFINNST